MADVRGTRFSTPSPPDQASAFLGFLTSKFPIVNHRRPVVTVEKPERLLRRLFQAAVEIINRKCRRPPLPISTGCGSFHRPLRFHFSSHFDLPSKAEKTSRPGSSINDDRGRGRFPAWRIFLFLRLQRRQLRSGAPAPRPAFQDVAVM